MSFAIFETGGKQYKASASKIIVIEKLDAEIGKTIQFKNVLLINDSKTTEIGSPNVTGAIVEAKLLNNVKDRTILIFKKRRRQNSRRKNGHRQQYSLIRIKKIFSKDGKILAEAQKIVKPTKKIEKVKTKVTTKKVETKVATK